MKSAAILQFLMRFAIRVARPWVVITLGCWSMVVCAQETLPTPGPPVTVSLIDGTVVEGRWGGMDASRAIKIEAKEGATRLGWDELARVIFSSGLGDPAVGDTVFHLADGGLLVGDLVGSDGDALTGSTSLGKTTRLAFERLAGVELASRDAFPAAFKRFTESLADRLAARDVLVTRGKDQVKTVRGRLESLGPAEGMFALGKKTRTFKTEKIFGIVFAAGAGRVGRFPVMVRLRDGGRISGTVATSTRDRLLLATSLGFTSEIRLNRIKEIVVRSPRLVYLTDLAMEGESGEGRLHAKWEVGIDRNVAGAALRMGGRHFDRGLGMHSKTEVSYSLGREYELFVVTVGLDDAVRPRGSVVFRILGDNRVLFDSGLVMGTDTPRDIHIDVNDVDQMVLVVDYGDGLDLSDYADWGDARLIKPREGR